MVKFGPGGEALELPGSDEEALIGSPACDTLVLNKSSRYVRSDFSNKLGCGSVCNAIALSTIVNKFCFCVDKRHRGASW